MVASTPGAKLPTTEARPVASSTATENGMNQPRSSSDEQRPDPNESGALKAWTTPELVVMDVVDATRSGDVPRTHAEDIFYERIS